MQRAKRLGYCLQESVVLCQYLRRQQQLSHLEHSQQVCCCCKQLMRLEVCRQLVQHSSVLLQDILHVLHAAASEQRASMEGGRPICHPKHTSMHVSEPCRRFHGYTSLKAACTAVTAAWADALSSFASARALLPCSQVYSILNPPVPERLLAGLLLL